MKKQIIVLIAIAITISACNKGGGNNKSKADHLKTGSWHITASSSVIEYPAPVGTQTVDIWQVTDACIRDNNYTFNSNNTATMDEGTTKCDAGDPQTSTAGTWALLNGDTQLQINDGVNPSIISDILTLDENTLRLKSVTYLSGIKSTTTSTYNH